MMCTQNPGESHLHIDVSMPVKGGETTRMGSRNRAFSLPFLNPESMTTNEGQGRHRESFLCWAAGYWLRMRTKN